MYPTPANRDIYLGIDVGTGGVRVMAVDENGRVVASVSVDFGDEVAPPTAGHHEQPPEVWTRAVEKACHRILAELDRRQIRREWIRALAVDATSGTLVATAASGKPVRPALMYNDPRGGPQAEVLNKAAGSFCDKLGYRFKSSYAAAKVAWLKDHEPDTWRRMRHLLHQADYIVWWLTGDAPTTDYSNALKTGYDLIDERWPTWLEETLGCMDRLPRVVAPGTQVGSVSAPTHEATGLPEGTMVVAGATDGTAACLASGVCRPGDYNTTLGTTLVFKGVAASICRHPEGLVYCHKLPGGLWLPGAASNTGCHWIGAWFADSDPAAMDAAAAELLPLGTLAYPLVGRGERFPMLSPQAEAFFAPEPEDEVQRYAACLQGVALVERLAYDELDRVTGGGSQCSNGKGQVFATGGGSRSDVWMQCRADATGRVFHRPACGESAFGAAVLAACGARGDSLTDVIARMVRRSGSFTPKAERQMAYDELYQAFGDQLRQRGYL